MKRIVKVSLLLSVISTLIATAALGQNRQVIRVDEFGHGLDAVFGPDPTGGVPGSVLQYFLPFSGSVVPGDVGIFETNNATVVSDLVRFFNNPFNNRPMMIFYSEAAPDEPPPIALADSGLPINGNPSIFLTEFGPPGSFEEYNLAEYFCNPGMPGSDGNPNGIRYLFQSDGVVVPEPGAISLVITGLAILCGAGLRRKKRCGENTVLNRR